MLTTAAATREWVAEKYRYKKIKKKKKQEQTEEPTNENLFL